MGDRAKNVDLHLRVPPDLAEWLQAEAVAHERSLQGQIVFLLKRTKKETLASTPTPADDVWHERRTMLPNGDPRRQG